MNTKKLMAARFHFIKHKKSGLVMDVPDKSLEETLARGEHEYVEPVADYPTDVKDVPIIEELPEETAVDLSQNQQICPICGYSAKSAKSLAIHNGRSHKA